MITIELYDQTRLADVVRLALRAWEPVFTSIEDMMDPQVYRAQYPAGWEAAQRAAVEAVCKDEDLHVCVAVEDSHIAGFAALKLHKDDRMGEIYMIAVDPDFQRRGVAGALTRHAIEWLTQAGMTTAMVETGGDPGHAGARRTYEAAGFRQFPVARYFKKL